VLGKVEKVSRQLGSQFFFYFLFLDRLKEEIYLKGG